MSLPRFLSKRDADLLETLTAGLEPGDGRRLGERGDVFMPCDVYRLGDAVYSVGHYHCDESTAFDRVPDPEIRFCRLEAGCWLVAGCDMAVGTRWEALTFTDGRLTGWRPRVYAEVLGLARLLFRNVRYQQADALKALRAA